MYFKCGSLGTLTRAIVMMWWGGSLSVQVRKGGEELEGEVSCFAVKEVEK